MKTTKEEFAAYMRWQKYILSTYPDLPKGCKRPTLIAYALAMAIHGTNGLDCFASDSRMKEALGLTNRGTVAKYRKLALNLGWFVRNGKRRGRAESLDVSIPSETEGPNAPQISGSLVTSAAHIRGISITTCPACQPSLKAGDIREFAKAQAVHNDAVKEQPDAPPW